MKKMRHVLVLVTPAYQPRLAGIARYARQHGWQLTMMDRLARRPRGWNGDGVLTTLRSDPVTISFAKSLLKRKVPIVDLTFNHPSIPIPRVSGNHFAIGHMAREHFEERNFRNFAWFSTDWLNIHRLRFEGFSATSSGKIDGTVARWVLSEEMPSSRIDDFAWFDKWLGEKLRAAPKPLALLAYDDSDAARALGACIAAGVSVPEDVAILGIGGDRLICENQVVALSTVEHDQGRTGYEGAQLLDRLMAGEPPPKFPILSPPRRVTVRASTDIVAASNATIRKALEYIRSHLASSFGLSQVAAGIGVSRATLSRLFKAEMGRSLGAETLRQRMAAAKRMLSDDSLTIAEIAYKTGFCNPAYFTNTFIRHTGMTPKAWRTDTPPPYI